MVPWVQVRPLLLLFLLPNCAAEAEASGQGSQGGQGGGRGEQDPQTSTERCLAEGAPESRSDFPALLNCLGLLGEAVEVGVQAGVHASSFLERWRGRHLRLVDKWSAGEEASQGNLFYVDIANVHGADVGRQHRARCESRLAPALRTGRAEIVGLDSEAAAAGVRDGELDFVYLDARHDFAGVAVDIQAWWPKVRVGGVFAGHDFVDGEFPEGDFFWISALREVLPGLEGSIRVTREKNMYPSFFVVKTEALAGLVPLALPAEQLARRLYAERSKYFALWRDQTRVDGGENVVTGTAQFLPLCGATCTQDCDTRIVEFTPTRSAASTLRPFACGWASDQGPQAQSSVGVPDACAAEMVVDVKAYHDVCLERCNVTCLQRSELFSQFGAELLAV